MKEQQRHEMIWGGTLPSGAEEWSCPICGRRTLINWEPEFKRTILEAGNSFAIHSAVKGDVPVESLHVNAENAPSSEEPPHPDAEDYRLDPWRVWLDKVDFDRLWNDVD